MVVCTCSTSACSKVFLRLFLASATEPPQQQQPNMADPQQQQLAVPTDQREVPQPSLQHEQQQPVSTPVQPHSKKQPRPKKQRQPPVPVQKKGVSQLGKKGKGKAIGKHKLHVAKKCGQTVCIALWGLPKF